MKRTSLLARLLCICASAFCQQVQQAGFGSSDLLIRSLEEKIFSDNDIHARPALIPLPQKVEWAHEKFELKNYTAIIANNQQSKPEALGLQAYLADINIRLPIKAVSKPGERTIELQVDAAAANQNSGEAYQLLVTQNNIR